MTILLVIFHVGIALALILIVLLQTGKGSDLASAFGGGGQNAVFGGAGPSSFLNKMTTGVAVLFMATSITLAYVSSGVDTIMGDREAVEETVVDKETATDSESGVDVVPEGNVVPETDASVEDNAASEADAAPAENSADDGDVSGETETEDSSTETQ
ncbi:preprotein translocase subunit SecG [bacterium]|nr:preprotein translocase subunit SecG [bacterium]